MTQNAVVRRLVAGRAEIEVKRVSACGHSCEECGGGCSEMVRTGPVVVLADNPLNAQPGDRVVVESSTRRVLGFAAVVYLLPIVLFFAGCFIAGALGAGEGAALAWGGGCFAASVGIAVLVDRRIGKTSRVMFSIVAVSPS